MDSDNSLKLLGVKEAARKIKLSKSTLDKMRIYGGGPIFSKLGRSVRYLESDLVEWVANNRRASTSVVVGG